VKEKSMTEWKKVFSDILTLRIRIYSHLTRVFYGICDAEVMQNETSLLITYARLTEQRSGEFGEACCRYQRAVQDLHPHGNEQLLFEFNRLFVGPGRLVAPPYESVYRSEDGLVMGESTVAARSAYAESGLAMRNSLREPEDHIATELEFLLELQNRALSRITEGSLSELVALMRTQRKFIGDHLLLWIPAFCRRIEEGTRLEYFGALSRLLSTFITQEVVLASDLEATLAKRQPRNAAESGAAVQMEYLHG
jgi:TorA maturation chaperone TorD